MAGLLSTPRQEHSSGATLQDIDTNALASTRLNQILNSNSDLMKTSMTRGLQTANQRGLLNSTFAAEAGAKAMIDSATPIAQIDSTNTANQSLANQRYINEFGMQNDQQDWQSGENALDRGHDITLQGNDQRWQSGEKGLDREHDVTLQGNEFDWKGGQNALDRSHDLTIQGNDQGWKSGENALDRAENRYLQDDQQNFLRDSNEFDWQQKFAFQDDQQGFEKGQNEFDWQQKFGLQNDAQDFTKGENQADREYGTSEREASQNYNTSERVAGQEYNTGEREATQNYTFDYLNAETKNQLTLQNDAQEWDKQKADRAYLHDIDMFDKGASHDQFMANLNGQIESGLVDKQVGANIQGFLMNSLDSIQSSYRQQSFNIMNNNSMDQATKDKYVADMFGYWEAPAIDENGEPVLDENGNQVMEQVSAGTEGAIRVKGMIDYEVEDAYAMANEAPNFAALFAQTLTGGA